MSGGFIPAWSDREGRVWLDTGRVSPTSKEPIIELLNGEASGALGWVNREFGPLENLSVHSMKQARRTGPAT